MGLVKGGPQPTPIQMRIDLCRRKVPMTQEFLNNSNSRSALQEMSGKRMPKRVRRYAGQPGQLSRVMRYPVLNRSAGDAAAGPSLKYRILKLRTGQDSVLQSQISGRIHASLQVSFQSGPRLSSQRQDPLPR